MYPSFGEYSLIGLNFWILFNIKFLNLPHGYYFAYILWISNTCIHYFNLFQLKFLCQVRKKLLQLPMSKSSVGSDLLTKDKRPLEPHMPINFWIKKQLLLKPPKLKI